MWAFAAGLAVLMWLSCGLILLLVRCLSGKADYAIQAAWLAVGIAIMAAALLAVAWLVLPASYISRGWTRDMLDQAQRLSLFLLLVTAAAGFIVDWRRLRPAPAAAKPQIRQRR